MKKYLLLLICFPTIIYSQNFGFNGAGFFENYNQESVQWLHDWNQPFTLRIPGGAISKFHDPFNNREGWGMSEENINDWFQQVGFDEDGQGLDKWLRKANEQPNRSFMDDLIQLQKEFPQMQVIYVLNILNSTPEANLNALKYMIKGGVNIVGVEAGNEVYGKYQSFSEYATDFEPVFQLIQNEFPNILTAICAAPMKGQKEKDLWNEQMSKYKGEYDAAIIHFYYTKKELSNAFEKLPEGLVFKPAKFEKDLESAFIEAKKVLMGNELFTYQIDHANELFKGKKIWITEWNTKPSEAFNNTLLNGAWQFKSMLQYKMDVQYLCIHNGISPDKYGMISRRNKYDAMQTDLIKRMGYYAFQLASEVENGIELLPNKTYKVISDEDKTVCFYFTNLDVAYKPDLQYLEAEINAATIHFIQGKNLYSSAGIAGFMGKGTEPNHEINGIKVEKYTGEIPSNSFGYIEIEFK